MNPQYLKKAREEIDNLIIKPYLKESGKDKLEFNEICTLLNMEN